MSDKTVPCIDASGGDEEELVDPEPGARCEHDICRTAELVRLAFASASRGALTNEERTEMMADRELMRDEFHGRGW